MLSNIEGLRKLQLFEAKAKEAAEGAFVTLYNSVSLIVFYTPGDPEGNHQYRWGSTMIERHTALRVVQSFEPEPRR